MPTIEIWISSVTPAIGCAKKLRPIASELTSSTRARIHNEPSAFMPTMSRPNALPMGRNPELHSA